MGYRGCLRRDVRNLPYSSRCSHLSCSIDNSFVLLEVVGQCPYRTYRHSQQQELLELTVFEVNRYKESDEVDR